MIVRLYETQGEVEQGVRGMKERCAARSWPSVDCALRTLNGHSIVMCYTHDNDERDTVRIPHRRLNGPPLPFLFDPGSFPGFFAPPFALAPPPFPFFFFAPPPPLPAPVGAS